MAKVTSKLQLTLPKALADRVGIRPGDELEVRSVGRSLWLLPERHAATRLSRGEKLRLFDDMTARADARARELAAAGPLAAVSDWSREALYEDRLDDRPRRH